MKLRNLSLLVVFVFLATFARGASTAYWQDASPGSLYIEFNPAPVFSTTNSGHTVKALQSGQSMPFAATSSSVGIYSYTSTAAGRTLALLQDGVQVGSVVIPATGSGSYTVYNLATGLDTGSVHEYEIVCITPVVPHTTSWYDGYVELDTGTLASVVHATRPIVGMYGDSITGGTAAHQTDINSAIITDMRYLDMWQATHATGKAMAISGTAGGKVVNTGRDSTGNIPTNVDLVRVEYGINDAPDLPAGNATFQTAYGTMIDNIRTQIGAGKKIICLQPFPTTSGTQQANIGTLIQAAISGKADVSYVPTAGWFTPNTTTLPDGTHPNAATYALIANREIPVFSTTSFTISGPGTCSLGTPSSDFTVTLANGATFCGDQTITITTSSGTIDATAAGGSISGDNTSAPAVTPASGATSFTFKLAAGTSGAITLTPSTALAGWTPPSAPTCTAISSTKNVIINNFTPAVFSLP